MSINLAVIGSVFGPLIIKRRWVCWKKVMEDDKVKKVPINPRTGTNAKSNDPSTWATLVEAAEYRKNHENVAGIMVALSSKDSLIAMDIDNCIDAATNKLSEFAEQVIQVLDSYTEISPSRRGIRILARGQLPLNGRKNSNLGFEIYDAARFMTITGNHVENTPMTINERDKEILQIHQVVFSSQANCGAGVSHRKQRELEFDDDDLMELASNSENGDKFEALFDGEWSLYYSSHSEADCAFASMLAFWSGWNIEQMDRIFRQSGLYRDKWDKRHYADGRTYGQGVLQAAIKFTENCFRQEYYFGDDEDA